MTVVILWRRFKFSDWYFLVVTKNLHPLTERKDRGEGSVCVPADGSWGGVEFYCECATHSGSTETSNPMECGFFTKTAFPILYTHLDYLWEAPWWGGGEEGMPVMVLCVSVQLWQAQLRNQTDNQITLWLQCVHTTVGQIEMLILPTFSTPT